MKYQGGKARLAKTIAPILGGGGTLVSLFCGACNVEALATRNFENVICNDNHPYLIAMFKALQNGFEPPDVVTEEQYKYLKANKDENPALTGFVGFACSFGGRWFEGYARGGNGRNYALSGKRSLIKMMPNLRNVKFICSDYHDVELPDGCIVYADPPYNGTKQFQNKKFDTDEFWRYMRLISEDHIVFISELHAPDDFVCIWEKQVTRTLDRNKDNYFKATEKLFIHQNNIKRLQQTNDE